MNTFSYPLTGTEYLPPRPGLAKADTELTDMELAIQLSGASILRVDLVERKIRFSVQQASVCTLPEEQDIPVSAALSLIVNVHQHGLLNAFRNAVQGSKELDYEFELKASGKTPKWLRIKGIYKQPCGGTRGYFVCMLTDVSLEKEKANRRNELVAMLNHDLRTPLTTIKLYMQMFANLSIQCEHFQIAELLEIASKQVDVMTRMTENFLETTVLESGRIKISKTAFDMATLIETLVQTEYRLKAKHQILINCPDKMWLDADKDKVTQVLHNYISNAIKYSPEGTVIAITGSKLQGEIIISVKDYGIGISIADQKKLFSKFFRSESKPVQKIKGYGIGLYLVHDIIAAHGGKVWASSVPGNGSTFYFSLPL